MSTNSPGRLGRRQIQQTEGRYAAVLGDASIPLPAPPRRKGEAVEACRLAGEGEAAEALGACALSYAVAQGAGIEQLIEVVTAAPAGVFVEKERPGDRLRREVVERDRQEK